MSGILGGSGLGSILGGVLGGGGGGGTHQPQYQPSGGYGNYPQQNQGGGGGSDLLGGLLSSALDGLSKHVSYKVKKNIQRKLTPKKMNPGNSAY